MGCLKLTYQNFEPTLKVVYKNGSFEQNNAQRFLSYDPRPQISTSPYSTFSNNPIVYTDLKGDTSEFYGKSSGKLLGVINDEGALRRIKIDENLYNEAMASSSVNVGRRSGQERSNYIANFVIGSGVLEEMMTGRDVIAFETGNYRLDFTAVVLPKNLITFPKKISSNHADNGILGYMTLSTIFDDMTSLSVGTYNMSSGPYNNGPTPNNAYVVAWGEDGISDGKPIWNPSTNEAGMLLNSGNNGWKLRLPNFNGRSGLLIHPDCNSRGTAGCIGIRENDATLIKLGNFFDNYIRVQKRTLIINFQVLGNPNYGNEGNATNSSGQ